MRRSIPLLDTGWYRSTATSPCGVDAPRRASAHDRKSERRAACHDGALYSLGLCGIVSARKSRPCPECTDTAWPDGPAAGPGSAPGAGGRAHGVSARRGGSYLLYDKACPCVGVQDADLPAPLAATEAGCVVRRG